MGLLLESGLLTPYFDDTAIGSIQRRRRTTVPVFLAAQIKLPDTLAQRRIVHLIGAFDAQVAALEAEAACARDLLNGLRTREFKGLEASRDLASVMTQIRSGGTPRRGLPAFYQGDIPWLKSGEDASPWITDTEEKIAPSALAESSAWLVPAESLVIAMYGATAAQVGYLAVPMATNQAVLALVPDASECDGRFAYHWLRYHSAALKRAASGAAQPNLSKAVILREMSFPALDVASQRIVGQALDAAENVADCLAEEARAIGVCRTRLGRTLLRGEVAISESYDGLLVKAV